MSDERDSGDRIAAVQIAVETGPHAGAVVTWQTVSYTHLTLPTILRV